MAVLGSLSDGTRARRGRDGALRTAVIVDDTDALECAFEPLGL